METSRSTTLFLFALLGGVLASLWIPKSESRAGTAVRMDLTELVDGSDLVVEASVVSRRAHLGADGLVYTDYTLRVDRSFWGDNAPLQTVRLPGGVLASGRGTLVPGMATLREGENHFLMLSGLSGAGARMIVGLSQGAYRIHSGLDGRRFAVRDGQAGALIQTATGTLQRSMGSEVIDYAEMLARLESATGSKRARLGDRARNAK